MTDTRESYAKRLWTQSRKAFERHAIRTRDNGRWMLQRPNEVTTDSDAAGNVGWTWIMGAEIVCMGHQAIAVVGDIDTVVFAQPLLLAAPYGGNDYLGRIFWMGRCTDMGYVAEKARDGMSDGGKVCAAYEEEVAQDDLASMIEDQLKDLRHGAEDSNIEEELEKALESLGVYGDSPHHDARVRALAEARNSQCDEGQDRLIHFLYDYPDVEFEGEELYGLGMVVAPRVFYAQAAVARLAELLTEESKSDADGDTEGG